MNKEDYKFFMKGGCHYFATALHEKLNYTIVVLVELIEWETEPQQSPYHVVGRDKHLQLFDYTGKTCVNEIEKEYNIKETVNILEYNSVEGLVWDWCGHGKPLFEMNRDGVNRAKKIIDERIDAF